VAVGDEGVQPPRVGGVEEIQAEPGEVERGRAEAARPGEVLEDGGPHVAIEAVPLRFEVGDDDVELSVTIQVTRVRPIPPIGRPARFKPAPEMSEMSSNFIPPRFRKRKFIVVSLAT